MVGCAAVEGPDPDDGVPADSWEQASQLGCTHGTDVESPWKIAIDIDAKTKRTKGVYSYIGLRAQVRS